MTDTLSENRITGFPFLFIFTHLSPSLTPTLFFSLFSSFASFFCLLYCCCLVALFLQCFLIASLCYLLTLPCALHVASSYCLIASSPHCITTSLPLSHYLGTSSAPPCRLVMLLHSFSSLPHHATSSNCSVALSPRRIILLLRVLPLYLVVIVCYHRALFCYLEVPSDPHPCNLLLHYLVLHCIMFHHLYFPLLSSFVRRSLELGETNFPTTTKEASFFFGLVFFCLFFSLRSFVLDLCFVLFLFYFFDSHHMFV